MKLPENASESVKRRNPHLFSASRVCPDEQKPNARKALERDLPGEVESRKGAASGPEGAGYCRILFSVWSVRPTDWDNAGTIKEVQDLLVKSGILPDDSYKVIREGTVITQKALRKEDERTEIVIERI